MAVVARSTDLNLRLKNWTAVTVGVAAVQLQSTNAEPPAFHGVWIQAASNNSVSIFLGPSTVTASATVAAMELTPGEKVFLSLQDLVGVYAIAASAAQTIKFVSL